jgi:hypothetical protein
MRDRPPPDGASTPPAQISTVFAQLALAGFVIAATAWLLLGAQIATGRVRATRGPKRR